MSDGVFIVEGRDVHGQRVSFTFSQKSEYLEFVRCEEGRDLMVITNIHKHVVSTAQAALKALRHVEGDPQ